MGRVLQTTPGSAQGLGSISSRRTLGITCRVTIFLCQPWEAAHLPASPSFPSGRSRGPARWRYHSDMTTLFVGKRMKKELFGACSPHTAQLNSTLVCSKPCWLGNGSTSPVGQAGWHPAEFLPVMVTSPFGFAHPALRPHRPLHLRLPGIHGNEGCIAPAWIHILLPLPAEQPG